VNPNKKIFFAFASRQWMAALTDVLLAISVDLS